MTQVCLSTCLSLSDTDRKIPPDPITHSTCWSKAPLRDERSNYSMWNLFFKIRAVCLEIKELL